MELPNIDSTMDVLLYGLVGAGIIALLLAIKIVSKALANRRIQGISHLSMTLDDLDRMRRTGLLDDEEYKRARSKLSRQFLESVEPKPALPAEVALQAELAKIEGGARPPSGEPAKPSAPPAPRAQSAAPPPAADSAPRPDSPAASKRGPSLAPFDVEELRRRGELDENEYERLKAYLRRQAPS